MAAIPDAGGARCAPRGVLCALLLGALLRVAVVGGLATAGWLLGSGIGQAHEDLVHQDLVHQDLAQQHNSMVRLVAFPSPDDDSDGLLSVPPTVKSTVTGVLRAVPRLPVRPPKVPVLTPVLAPVSKLVAPARPVAKKVEPQATNHKPAVIAPPPAASAEPVVPATTVVRPAPVHLMHNAPAAAPVCAAAYPVAGPVADQFAVPAGKPSTLGSGPPAPAPADPFGTTTAPCPSGSTGGGAVTSSGSPVTVSDGWSGMDLASTYCRLCADASGTPRAAAQRPSTSPD